jgi:hypothetical protein
MTGARPTALILAAGLTFAASATLAEDRSRDVGDSRMEAAFGSTIVSTFSDGRQGELWLKRDGTYEAEGRRHDRTSGTWKLKADKDGTKLCLNQRKPFAPPPFFSYCPALPDGSLDKPWPGHSFTGEQISIRLVRGIYDPAKSGQQTGGEKAQATPPDNNG